MTDKTQADDQDDLSHAMMVLFMCGSNCISKIKSVTSSEILVLCTYFIKSDPLRAKITRSFPHFTESFTLI